MTKSTMEFKPNMDEKEYCQIQNKTSVDKKDPPEKIEDERRYAEKTVYVLATLGVIFLSHVVTRLHGTIPYVYASLTPLLIVVKAVLYWRNKWQYFLIDFCYFTNTLTYIYLWMPEQENLFRVVFALGNGPVLMAAAMWRNSLVFHHHDKITSCYIHFLPAILTFCVRWYPGETFDYWYRSCWSEVPKLDPVWLCALPFCCFFLHSFVYFIIVNLTVKPKDPYMTSYSYLGEKYERLNFIGGPNCRLVLYGGGGGKTG